MSLENIVPVADVATLIETQNDLTTLADPVPTACNSKPISPATEVKCTTDGETCMSCSYTGDDATMKAAWDVMDKAAKIIDSNGVEFCVAKAGYVTISTVKMTCGDNAIKMLVSYATIAAVAMNMF